MPSDDKPNRFYSKRQEDKVAKIVNGNRTANSGATLFQKGDVTTDKLMIECKTLKRPQKSHTLQREWFDKNMEEAFARGKEIPVVVFDFGDNNHEFMALRDDDFMMLLAAWLEINK